MIDQKLYQETFSRLCASDEAKKEVLLKMQEKSNKKRLPKVLRGVLIAAALTAALAVTVSAANTNMLEDILLTLVFSDGIHERMVDEEGNEYNFISIGGGTEVRDGRVIFSGMGEELDITDALEADGVFTKTYDADGMEVVVTITGTVEEHTLEIVTPEATITQAYPANKSPAAADVDAGLVSAEPMEGAYIPAGE